MTTSNMTDQTDSRPLADTEWFQKELLQRLTSTRPHMPYPRSGFDGQTGLPKFGVLLTGQLAIEAMRVEPATLDKRSGFRLITEDTKNQLIIKREYFAAEEVKDTRVYIWVEVATTATVDENDQVTLRAAGQIMSALKKWGTSPDDSGRLMSLQRVWTEYKNATKPLYAAYLNPKSNFEEAKVYIDQTVWNGKHKNMSRWVACARAGRAADPELAALANRIGPYNPRASNVSPSHKSCHERQEPTVVSKNETGSIRQLEDSPTDANTLGPLQVLSTSSIDEPIVRNNATLDLISQKLSTFKLEDVNPASKEELAKAWHQLATRNRDFESIVTARVAEETELIRLEYARKFKSTVQEMTTFMDQEKQQMVAAAKVERETLTSALDLALERGAHK